MYNILREPPGGKSVLLKRLRFPRGVLKDKGGGGGISFFNPGVF